MRVFNKKRPCLQGPTIFVTAKDGVNSLSGPSPLRRASLLGEKERGQVLGKLPKG